MLTKKRPSKLLFVLAEYFGFSILCGFVSFLFFSWASDVIANNYIAFTGTTVDLATWYFLKLMAFVPGILIFIFVLVILVRKKFSYIVSISNAIEEMEAGNLEKRITLEGDDELTDLAVSINHFAEAIQTERDASQKLKEEEFHTIATLSHDLRTPLTAVMSYLQFIRDGNYADQEKLAEYAQKAYEKACRIKNMTDDLFENCKNQIEQEPALTKVDGRTFIEQALWDMQDFLEDSGYEVKITLPEHWTSFSLMVDIKRVPSVIDNLLSNIKKYAEKQMPILLDVKTENHTLVFAQQNTTIPKTEQALAESNLLGLKSVEKTITLSGGTFHIREEEETFLLEIRLPMIQEK